jgi:peptidoglycan/xylan/chitin deacetylase (PgdA/CDA1 family)
LEVIRRVAVPTAVRDLLDDPRPVGRRCRIAVTFDDGYADNLIAGKPLLERFETPATVFVATGLLGKRAWWDALAALMFHDEDHSPEWSVERVDDPSSRHTRFRALADSLRYASHVDREATLGELRLEFPRAKLEYPFLSSTDVVALAEGGLIEIGAHTVTHPVLARATPDEQAAEIRESRLALEEILQEPVTGFAYPYGTVTDYSRETKRAARAAGLRYACANRPGRVGRHSDPLELPRFIVRNWDGDEFERRLGTFMGHRL